mmetsp:Transcript_36215/g.63808  ORF Transcript_36215/g.63808 Transcript_36215/m.63808 type:complete len:353 (-) Transcript_36215:112-1170(-)
MVTPSARARQWARSLACHHLCLVIVHVRKEHCLTMPAGICEKLCGLLRKRSFVAIGSREGWLCIVGDVWQTARFGQSHHPFGNGKIESLAVSSSHIAVGCSHNEGRCAWIYILSSSTCAELNRFDLAVPRSSICRLSLAYKPSGNQLAAACGEWLVLMSEIGEVHRRICLAGIGFVTRVTYRPDGAELAIACKRAQIRFVSLLMGLRFRSVVIDDATGIVNDAAYRPDGKHLAIACPGSVYIIDAPTGEMICKVAMGYGDWFDRIVYRPDGNQLAVASATGRRPVPEIATWPMNVVIVGSQDLAYEPSGEQLAFASSVRGLVDVIKADTLEVTSHIDMRPASVSTLAFYSGA